MGPLSSIKVIEFAGIGPGPFCAMMLADMGADVIRIEGKSDTFADGIIPERRFDTTLRGRRSIVVDLKNRAGVQAALALVTRADVLLEGYRPGVMERLGLGPEACLARNPALVYGRMTGWGQSGPLAAQAGHDINFIALSGALHCIGQRGGPPTVPFNLVGDYGGGGLMLAFGVVCAILESRRSGMGQVVDSAISEGSALLCTMAYGVHAAGLLDNQRGESMFDGGAHFYGTYECSDGRYVAIGSMEPKFYAELLERLGLDTDVNPPQMDPRHWPAMRARLNAVFRTRTRDQWCEVFRDVDACIAPVLDWDEAPCHPQNEAREAFVVIDGVVQPAPAPRFSRTPGAVSRGPARAGEHTDEVLAEWGFAVSEVNALRAAGAIPDRDSKERA